MPFTLGKHSLKELNGVHPDLVTIVQRAIEITVQNFALGHIDKPSEIEY